MSAKKSGYSPRSVQGVNFFHHFPRQRLRPYGEIKEPTADRQQNSGVHRLLKYAITDDTFDKMEHLGMLLHVMGSHQKQLCALIRNSVEYSRKCEQLPAAHDDFKVFKELVDF